MPNPYIKATMFRTLTLIGNRNRFSLQFMKLLLFHGLASIATSQFSNSIEMPTATVSIPKFEPGMCFKSMTPKTTTSISPKRAPTSAVPYKPSSQWLQDCLAAHNHYRKLDGLPPLVWDQTLSARAYNQASRLAAAGFKLIHDGMGENLNLSTEKSCSHSVSVWFEEKYAAGYQKYGTRGHYNQLSSKIATRVGCGIASSVRRNMISCKYDRAF